jgi:hypothetical protein
VAEARAALGHIRVSGAGIDIMEKKALFRVVRVSGLDVRAANILKQEMLSRGGEVATSREVYELRGGSADCLVMGTLTQFDRLLPKLKQQPFGLRRLAEPSRRHSAITTSGSRRPARPDLTDARFLWACSTSPRLVLRWRQLRCCRAVQAALTIPKRAPLSSTWAESTVAPTRCPGGRGGPRGPGRRSLAGASGRVSVDTYKPRWP